MKNCKNLGDEDNSSIYSSKYLKCTLEGPRNVGGYGYIGSRTLSETADRNNTIKSMTVENILKLIDIKINELTSDYINFDLIGVDAAVANALRRILLVEVPTVAIETVQIYQNSGVIQDEVLAHRLGLIPFNIDLDLIDFRAEDQDLNEKNSVCFKLCVECNKDDIDDKNGVTSKAIYSKDLIWVPMSESQKRIFEKKPPSVVYPDILITKLRPGQVIEAILYCEKGIGKTHAKWSPVSTATYRLLPEFKFPEGYITGKDAKEFVEVCPMNVFDIEDITGKVYVKNPRNCTTCRACIEKFPKKVELFKNKHHFIFSIESTGSISPIQLVKTAINILRVKSHKINHSIDIFYE
ncbi:DNA-directed RNA polymerases I and III subunit RPAC1 [Cryptosporidium andersoni]|uniref:DNA-directed RNA polymerases I and III subunit RPAC1 n=1 Tax=Cryptosporidium andersoni TaxID=117008 RepID=A0A1J4MSG6_9CRYT|nr:DNA-directed RNA polymerases I and III subunit RPAC1 [Cryptosporidium andersoni]